MHIQIDLWWRDLQLACRNAARRPGFTLLIVMTLALGIGIHGAVFAIVDAVLLRPLPYKDPARVVFVWQTLPAHNVFELEATPADYTEWQRLRSFESLALVATGSFTLTGGPDGHHEPERVLGTRSTSTLLPLLGISPRLGRGFIATEYTDAAPQVVMLSDGLWRRRFGGDPAIVGRTIQVDGSPHTVVGVMPPGAVLPARLAKYDALWLPARMTTEERTKAISHNYTILGRLAGQVTPAAASAELAAMAASQAAERPDKRAGIGARVVAASEDTVREIRPALLVLMAGVGILLLIASANVSTLLLARASHRRREVAVRAALGATAGRLASLAITESVVLTCLGALAGLTLGGWVLEALLPAFSGSLPRVATVEIGGRVAIVTMAISLVLGVVLGVVVAAQKPDDGLAAALKSGARSSGGPDAARTRNVLVVAQVAFSVVLLATAGLLVRSVVRLQNVKPGFSADHALTFRLALPDSGYAAPMARRAFVDDIMNRLNALPGVTLAAVNSVLPLGGSYGGNSVAIEGQPVVSGESIILGSRDITPEYFAALAIPLVAGHGFTARDDATAEQVTIINRTMARQWWPTSDPLNQRIRITAGPQAAAGWLRIVGIAGDVRHNGLAVLPAAEMYRPFAQRPAPEFTVVVRTAGDPAAMVPAARARLQQIDPNLPMYDVRTMEDRIADSFADVRATALLLLVTAGLATILAAVAIYGSIWYAVTQRIPEIGIRLALGASRMSVCRQVMGGALWLTGAGTAIGVAAALAAGPLVRGLLFDTPPADPATYAAVIICLMGLTAAASVLPARRAMSVDPLIALRSE